MLAKDPVTQARLDLRLGKHRERPCGRRDRCIEGARRASHAGAGCATRPPALAASSQITPPIASATGTTSTARASDPATAR